MIPPPELSVLMPVHQARDGFGDALRSVLMQTELRLELILVLNASDPSTAQQAAEFAAVFHNIKCIEEPRKGIQFALNTGLNHCQAPFIARMDADDLCLPGRFAAQLNVLLHRSEISLVSSRVSVPQNPNNAGFRAFVDWQNQIISHEQHLAAMFHESPVAHPSVMFRKSALLEWGTYTGRDDIPEDYDLWLRWLLRGAKFLKLPEVLLQWNDHPERLSRTANAYSEEAFNRVRYAAIADYFIGKEKKWWVCGGGRISKRKITRLESAGLKIAGVIDVVHRKTEPLPFLLAGDFKPLPGEGVLNLLSGREQRPQVADYLNRLGLAEGLDWFTIG